ncbi:FUSC family protein [Pedobacter sp. MC2016-14]|uniref:FUSC family membrane protein n=1 Tax=Pedobacter sp. MC2016-14 TaxID=2897327 RepID=UPI001E58B4D1|nr:FUSC family membrane protein [Pedobacter sp. MC2016-14]MCD0489437.1 FUSC family protein [Pedobacter sp. MC2016-14]
MGNYGTVRWTWLKLRLLNFFTGEYVTDALRNTITIVLPITLLFMVGNPKAAIGIGVGTLLISLTDLPGNKRDKFGTGGLSILVFFLTALIISSAIGKPWLTATAFFVLTFLLSMLSVFGSRAGLSGTMAIILSTFTLGLHPDAPLLFSFYILIGALWYYLISFIQITLWPYRSLHHAIFECINSTAFYLQAKAKCYNPQIPLEECYQEGIGLHIAVSEKQDLVRNLLLSDKTAMKPSNLKGQRLLLVAQSVIGLYEQVTAIHYDYNFIRQTLKPSESLPHIEQLIKILAESLEQLGRVFLNSSASKYKFSRLAEFNKIQHVLQQIAQQEDKVNATILFRIIENMEEIARYIQQIREEKLKTRSQLSPQNDPAAYALFLSQQRVNFSLFKQHLSLKSATFRFSLRLAISFLLGYAVILLFPQSNYSYWILLTIVIVARPRFAITWKRNKERLSGTFAGLIVGLLLLWLISDPILLLIIAAIMLFGFFAFNRIRYSISVMCITPAVMLCLTLYHGHTDHIITERVYFTVAGCAIAFLNVYLFPIWENSQLKTLIASNIEANVMYLKEVLAWINGEEANMSKCGLARKNAHLKLARFSEALAFTTFEPKSKHVNLIAMRAVQTLIFRINAVITSLQLSAAVELQKQENEQLAVQVMNNLNNCLEADLIDEPPSGQYIYRDFPHQLDYLLSLSAQLEAQFKKK